MLEILIITTPIFGLIGMGYIAVRTGHFPKAGLGALGAFVVRVALPVLLFKSISQRSFAEVFNLHYLGAYALGSVSMLGLGILWARKLRGQPLAAASIFGMGMSCSNSAYVGFPIVLQVIGPSASMALALTMIVENAFMLPLCLAIGESAGARHEPFHRAFGRGLYNLRKVPIVIAMVVAFVFSGLHIGLPAPAWRAVDMLAAASAPVALFYIGGNLVGLPLRDMLADVSVVTVGKLVLHPLLVFGGLLLFAPVEPHLAVGAVLMASVPMLSIYPIFGQRHGQEGFCAATLLVATVLSFVTIAASIWLLQQSQVFPLLP
jgi:malonate transporter and related proteins